MLTLEFCEVITIAKTTVRIKIPNEMEDALVSVEEIEPIPVTSEIRDNAIEAIGTGELGDTMADFIRKALKPTAYEICCQNY